MSSLLASLLFAGPALAADAPLAVDYLTFQPQTWSGPGMACKHAKLGLRCKSDAENRRSEWAVFGPSAGTITGSFHVDAILAMKWGGATGVVTTGGGGATGVGGGGATTGCAA